MHGNAPESWNDAEIKTMPGVIATVQAAERHRGGGRTLRAGAWRRGDALKVTWKKGKADGFNSEQALEDYVKIHDDPERQADADGRAKGDAKAAFASAAKTYKAEFRSDYGYHAQMEPLNAVARFNDAGDRVEVWEGTQAPDTSRDGGGEGARLQARAGRRHTSATWAAASAGARSATTRPRPR